MQRSLFFSFFSCLTLFYSLLSPSLALSELPASPLFKLDSEWKLIQVSPNESGGIRSTFIKKSKGPRGLSAVVATETSKLSLEAYGKAVKKLVQEDPKCEWRKLGFLKSGLDKGLLAEVDHPSPYGPITMLQFITKKDTTFFILTLTANKEEFVDKRSELMQIVRSFELAKNPLEWLRPKQSTILLSIFEELKKSAEKCVLAQKAHQKAEPYTPESITQAASPLLKKEKSDIQPCTSVLLDQIGKASLEHTSRKMMGVFFASEEFQKRLWPKFGEVIHKHFGHLGPAWELETLLFIQREFIHLPEESSKS